MASTGKNRATRETLAEIEKTTWDVTLRAIDGEQYVALPQAHGVARPSPWTRALT